MVSPYVSKLEHAEASHMYERALREPYLVEGGGGA